jgi:ACS family hexuronate transporter-like MFS transporter
MNSTGKYRWLICGLLFLATTINYIDRQILSLIKPILDDQLHWTNEDFGKVNAAFQGAYAVGVLGFGWFVDRFGSKLGYGVSIVAWSLAAMGHALVSTAGGFFNARIFLGLGEAGNFPSAIKSVAQWFPKGERALATSIFNAGSNMGAIVAPAIVPLLALSFGWQSPFFVAGVAGLLWLGLWMVFYDSPEKSKRVSSPELAYIKSDADEALEDRSGRVPWLGLLKYRQAWSFVVAKFMTDPVWYFLLTWLPDYFKSSRSLDIKSSWSLLVTIYAIVTVLSIFGGWLPGHLTKRGWSVTRARKTGMFIYALCVMPIFAATSVGNWMAVLLIGLAGAAHQAWSANLFTTVSDMFPKITVASIIGLGTMAGSIGGILFPIVTGKLLDHFKADPTAGYTILFGYCGLAYVVCFGIHHLLAPKFEQIKVQIVPDRA